MRAILGFLCAAMLFPVADGVCAEDAVRAVVVKVEPLRSEPYADATPVATLDRGSVVDIGDRRGGWIRVKAGGIGGWARILALRLVTGEKTGRDGPLASANGRQEATSVVATLGIRGVDIENTQFDSAARTVAAMHAGRDPTHVVDVRLSAPFLAIGRDALEFTITSSQDGYVYVLMAGSDGNTLDMLFPNQVDADNAIRAGESLSLPRPSWRIDAHGPAGKDTLLVIVADAARDFASAGFRPAGAFATADARGVTAKDIVLVTGIAPQSFDGDCIAGAKRTSALVPRCSNAFGSAVVVVVEKRIGDAP